MCAQKLWTEHYLFTNKPSHSKSKGADALRRTLDSLAGLSHKDWRAVVLTSDAAGASAAATVAQAFAAQRVAVEVGKVITPSLQSCQPSLAP